MLADDKILNVTNFLHMIVRVGISYKKLLKSSIHRSENFPGVEAADKEHSFRSRVGLIVFHEIQGLFFRHTFNVTDLRTQRCIN